jgi:hypothetical protein
MSHSVSVPEALPFSRLPAEDWGFDSHYDHKFLRPLHCAPQTRFIGRVSLIPVSWMMDAAIGVMWAAHALGLSHIYELTLDAERSCERLEAYHFDLDSPGSGGLRHRWAVNAVAALSACEALGVPEAELSRVFHGVKDSRRPPPGLWLGLRVSTKRHVGGIPMFGRACADLRVLRVCPREGLDLSDVLAGDSGVNWVVVEGRARWASREWIPRIVRSCVDAELPVYLDTTARTIVGYGTPECLVPRIEREWP